MRYLILTLLLLQSMITLAQEAAVTAAGSPIVIYRAEADFDDIKSNLEMAITGRGMLISNTLHISDMLNRTSADTGLSKKIYEKAESLEFCSILMSYRMSTAHPANMAICPLTIGIYVKVGESGHVYLTYRRPVMLGDADEVEQALTELFEGLIQESLE